MTVDATLRASCKRMLRRTPQRPRGFTLVFTGVTTAWLLIAPPTNAATTATLLPSGDAIELTGEGAAAPFKTTIPVHRSGGIRYFSAGVGMEERHAEYPPFSLKLILVAGPRAYLSRVGVTITDDSGAVRVDIPSDHVDGPWVFVDLPDGTYNIEAVSRGDRAERTAIRVSGGRTRTVYLRWSRAPELF